MKKHTNTIYGIAIILVFIGGLILLAGPGSKETPNKTAIISDSLGGGAEGAISISEKFFDFGAISMSRGKVSREFILVNNGAELFVVNKMYTSCMCTTASITTASKKAGPFGMPGHGFVPNIDLPVNIGESATIKVIFDPSAHGPAGVGRIERQAYLENNQGEPLVIGIAATVTP